MENNWKNQPEASLRAENREKSCMSNGSIRYEAKCCGPETSFVIITTTAASGPARSEGPHILDLPEQTQVGLF